jgi:hypothetical protein
MWAGWMTSLPIMAYIYCVPNIGALPGRSESLVITFEFLTLLFGLLCQLRNISAGVFCLVLFLSFLTFFVAFYYVHRIFNSIATNIDEDLLDIDASIVNYYNQISFFNNGTILAGILSLYGVAYATLSLYPTYHGSVSIITFLCLDAFSKRYFAYNVIDSKIFFLIYVHFERDNQLLRESAVELRQVLGNGRLLLLISDSTL